MKIRITKKGLPKHQIKGEVKVNEPIGTTFTPAGGYESITWKPISQQAVPVTGYTKPPKLVQSAPTELGKITTPNIVPVKQFSGNEWMNANQSKLEFAVNKFKNSKPVVAAGKATNSVFNAANVVSPFVQMWDNAKRNKDIERAYRDSLLSMGPVNYTENRGDYEINTGMVDPYNTGAKSKGQFAGVYYTPTMQDGGITLGPISFSDTPIFRNVYESASVMKAPVADNTYVRKAPMPQRNTRDVNVDSSNFREWIAQKESSNNYRATNKVSSASGKYQFIWSAHKKDISRLTGVRTKEEFLNSPDAQEAYFTYWDNNVLTPNAVRIKQQLGVPDSLEQIKARIHFAGPGGAYNYYATGKETVDAFGTTTSSYVKEDGGETFNPMKIRIVKTPTTEMEYGGQLGYGFDLGGRRVYTDMPESMSETVSNTLGPVPREFATIEAEKGETILSDVDGDGMKEHMKIGGKRHSEGGTPLAAEEGDFVFSDTKKMKIKSPQLLKLFGKTAKAGGYTPAQIAKQYDVNKYKAILQNPNSDAMSKKTAELMISNYEKKLGMLSLVQEAKKGFPSGIPSVADSVMPEAKYGGYLEEYQNAGPVKIKKNELTNYEKQGYKRVGDSNIWQLDTKKVEQVDPTKGTTTTKITPGKKYVPNENAWWRSLTPAQKAAHNAKVRKMIKEDPQYQDKTETITTPDTCQEGYSLNPTTGKCEKITPEVKQITYDETPGAPSVPGIETTTGDIPYEWTQQDKNNAMLALMKRGRVQKFSSVRQDVNPVMPDFRNMDWRGRAAEMQGTYNSQMSTMGTYQSPTSLAANMSFMAGQQAENLVNRAIDPIEQANVNIYNQVAGQRAGIMNQAIANNAQNKFLRSQDRAVLNQQYINALNDADSGLTQAVNQGITNAAGIYNTNLVESPYYFYDPRTQKMQFHSQNAKAAFENARRNAGPNDGDIAEQYLAIRKKLIGLTEDEKKLAMEYIFGMKNAGRTSATTYPFNPRMNRTTVQTPFPSYTNPMLMAQQQQQ